MMTMLLILLLLLGYFFFGLPFLLIVGAAVLFGLFIL